MQWFHQLNVLSMIWLHALRSRHTAISGNVKSSHFTFLADSIVHTITFFSDLTAFLSHIISVRVTNPVRMLIVGMFTLAVFTKPDSPKFVVIFLFIMNFTIIVPILFHDVKSENLYQLKKIHFNFERTLELLLFQMLRINTKAVNQRQKETEEQTLLSSIETIWLTDIKRFAI